MRRKRCLGDRLHRHRRHVVAVDIVFEGCTLSELMSLMSLTSLTSLMSNAQDGRHLLRVGFANRTENSPRMPPGAPMGVQRTTRTTARNRSRPGLRLRREGHSPAPASRNPPQIIFFFEHCSLKTDVLNVLDVLNVRCRIPGAPSRCSPSWVTR